MNWAIATRIGSITIDIRTPTPAAAGPSYDADTVAWAAAVVASGGSVSTTREDLVDALIVGLKTDGVWSKLDRLWLFAAENNKSALIDLKNLAAASEQNTPAFTTDLGYTPFITVSNVAFNYNVGTSAVNFTRDSAHISMWNLTAGSVSSPGFTDTATNCARIYPDLSGNTYMRLNEASSAGIAIADGRGFLLANRSGASAREYYRNGVSLGSSSEASVALTSDLTLLFDRQTAAISIGASLNPTEQLAFYNRLRTYMNGTLVP